MVIMWVTWCLFFLYPVGPGFHPSVRQQLSFQEDPEQWAVETSYSLTHGAETMAKFKGIGRGKKYNLMAQVIPLYGFGIFLYIFYIIYKVGHFLICCSTNDIIQLQLNLKHDNRCD